MHVTTTMRYHLTIRINIIKKSTTNAGEGMERQESSYTVVENVNWLVTVENSMEFPLKMKIELLYDL